MEIEINVQGYDPLESWMKLMGERKIPWIAERKSGRSEGM